MLCRLSNPCGLWESIREASQQQVGFGWGAEMHLLACLLELVPDRGQTPGVGTIVVEALQSLQSDLRIVEAAVLERGGECTSQLCTHLGMKLDGARVVRIGGLCVRDLRNGTVEV